MALLDEWNEELAAVDQLRPAVSPLARDGEEVPLFTLDHRTEFLTRGRGHAVAFTACNDTIFVATSRNYIIRHDTSNGADAVAELEISKAPDARVRRLFVDPLGIHALVTITTASVIETFYIDRNWKKARPLPRLRGLALTSVAWPPSLYINKVTEVLLGTETGALHELSIEDPKKEHTKQLYQLKPGSGVIAGLAQLALSSATRLVLVLSGTTLHLFRGGPTLDALFAAYDSQGIGAPEPRCFELPIEQGAAQLQVLGPSKLPDIGVGDPRSPPFEMPKPEIFAVLSPSGIYYGRLNLDLQLNDETEHLSRHKLLPSTVLQGSSPERPLALALTQYHFVLLYPSKLQFVNRSSKQVVQEVPLDRFAAPLRGSSAVPLGLCRDALAGRVLVLASDDALEVDATDEDRDMWKVLMQRGDFSDALPHCRTAAQRNTVYLKEAEVAMEEGRPVDAAKLFGRVTAVVPSFEDLALRLMDCGNPEALCAFLKARLGTLGQEDKAQSTMVATWLCELLLDRANRAALQRGDPDGEEKCLQADQDVSTFLKQHVDVLDAGTTVSMLAGYGREDDLLTFVRARGDNEATLDCLVQRGEAERAIELLRKPSVSAELAYKCAPALVALAPAQTVQAWIETKPPLDPRRLLPALLHLAEEGALPALRGEALRYVRYCVRVLGSIDPAVHNFAVALLTLDDENESALLEHLATARNPLGKPLYDPAHALRLCRSRKRHRAAVKLLCELEMWQDALELALTLDRELAVSIAAKTREDESLTRSLWLTIAKHVVREDAQGKEDMESQVRHVTELLTASNGILKIEDVLPLFPDFVEIDSFREAVCSSLEQHHQEMEDLRSEMSVATKTALSLRADLERVGDRLTATLDLDMPCARCGRELHRQPPAAAGPSGGALPKLFVFPTGNAFHGSCLCAEVADLAPQAQRERVLSAARRLASVAAGATTVPAGAGTANSSEPSISVEELRRLLESEIAVEDPYTGEIVVRNITKPLIEGRENEASWAL